MNFPTKPPPELEEWRVYKFDEEFVGGSAGTTTTIGENGWSSVASGGSIIISIAAETGHPGIKRLVTGAPTASRAAVYLAQGTSLSGTFRPDDLARHGAIIRPISTSSMRLQVGMSSTSDPASASELILVDFNTSGSSFYTTTTKTSGSSETYHTAYTPTSGSWIRTRWDRNEATGHLTPYINGIPGTAHTSSLPSDVPVHPIFNLFNYEAAVKQADIDAFYAETRVFNTRT